MYQDIRLGTSKQRIFIVCNGNTKFAAKANHVAEIEASDWTLVQRAHDLHSLFGHQGSHNLFSDRTYAKNNDARVLHGLRLHYCRA
jgi:hypothetical protein